MVVGGKTQADCKVKARAAPIPKLVRRRNGKGARHSLIGKGEPGQKSGSSDLDKQG